MLKVEKVYDSEKRERVLLLNAKGKKIITPTYFPAISRAEHGSSFVELLKLIMVSSYPRVLLSAYDYESIPREHKKRIIGEISNYLRTGGFMLVDSGGFESYWMNDNKWSFQKYSTSIRKMDFDLFFSYDILQTKHSSKDLARKQAVNVTKSARLRKKEFCIPIFHEDGPKRLMPLILEFAHKYPEFSKMIAIPERECGGSMLERASSISQIRDALNANGFSDTVMHILGCGNPLSMATYSYCGADTFDSVDWGTILIEPFEFKIYDIAQVELLKCKCDMCQKMMHQPQSRGLLHNLLFYQNFVLQLQKMIKEDTLKHFLLEFLGPENMRFLRDLAPSAHS